jgi:predicted PurR-regulated permease PerM
VTTPAAEDEPGAPPPPVTLTVAPGIVEAEEVVRSSAHTRSALLTGLLVLAIVYTIYFARAILLPIVIAVLLTTLFAPIVRALKRAWVPEPIGAAIVIFGLLGGFGVAIWGLSDPAIAWMHKLPESLHQIESKVRNLKRPVEELKQATQQVQNMAAVEGSHQDQQVVVKDSGILDVVFTGTQQLLVAALMMFILLYFLLASGDSFMRKFVAILPTLEDKKTAVDIVRQLQHDVSKYLLTITTINACLGIAVGVAMYFCGMPNAVLWGATIGVLNFIPYLGAVTTGVVIALVSLLTFDGIGRALVAPGVFTAITLLEGYVITPTILGIRLTMNPLVIFVWLILWGWMWGIPGTLIAVPLLAALKILCDRLKPLAPFGEFIGH